MTTSPVSDLQVLITARAIISSPEHWTKGDYAVSTVDRPCTVAIGHRFCASGACMRAIYELSAPTSNLYRETVMNYLSQAAHQEYMFEKTAPIYVFNDDRTTTHAQVLRVFDRAIENLLTNGGNNAG